MDVVVTGIGLQSCLGSLARSWDSLLAGQSGIKVRQLYPELPPYPLGLISEIPCNISSLTELVVRAAIEDAKIAIPLVDCGVAVGSSRGCQGSWEEIIREEKFVNSHSWLDTLPHQSAVTTARLIQTTAPVLSPMAACATGIHAIARGYELIQTGECQRVIAGAVESPITRLSLAGFDRMGALAKTGCYPFDLHREGLVLGEGGAVFVLETAELARRREAKIYGRILGFGLTCDASSLTAPEKNQMSSAIAIKNCLKRSDLDFNSIDYIHAHGTSTKLNDLHEAKLIQDLSAPRMRTRRATESSGSKTNESLRDRSIAVSSTKGATGHTLGASGAMGVAWCLMALKSGYLPPCVGLQELEFAINAIKKTQQQDIQNALCLSFGFGGQNAVLALGKYRST